MLIIQLCLSLCNPMDGSLPGFSVHEILPARILEWVAFPSPGYLPNPGIKPDSPTLQVDYLPLSHWGSPMTTEKMKIIKYNHCKYICWKFFETKIEENLTKYVMEKNIYMGINLSLFVRKMSLKRWLSMYVSVVKRSMYFSVFYLWYQP